MGHRSDDFKNLLHRLQEGDRAAAEELVLRYGPHIVGSIQRRFRRQKLRVLYSADDCMQSVWGSVFCNLDKIAQMESPEHLMHYLAKVASNKLVDQDRHLRAQRNDVERECALPGSQTADRFGLASPGPTPSAQVAAKDEWEQKTKGLSIEQRTILELRAMGHTSEEIAEKTEYSGRGIRRILDQLSGLFFR